MATSVKELDLPESQRVRILNCFHFAGIETIEDLCSKRDYDLLKMKNFGRKTLKSVHVALAARNLKLALSPWQQRSKAEKIRDAAPQLLAALKRVGSCHGCLGEDEEALALVESLEA